MKITIEYEEEEDARLALEAWDWKHTVLELDAYLRDVTKRDVYQNRTPVTVEYAMAEYLREQLREILNDNNLTL